MKNLELTLVLLESPYAGDFAKHEKYARLCLHDCFMRNEAPFASHLLYTQEFVLDDDVATERDLGINAGLKWGERAEKTVVYTDFGTSSGMEYGIKLAKKSNRPIEYRKLPQKVFAKHFR